MALTEQRARQLVDDLLAELYVRAPDVDKHVQYYRGQHPLRFASSEFRKFFAQQYAGFSDNWTQVVNDSPVERLTVTGVQLAGATEADKDLWEVWQRNTLDADSQLGFTAAGYGARAFVLVWVDPDEPDVPLVTFEDPRQAIVSYVPGSRRKRRAALKVWQDGSGECATLYLPDEVWKFERQAVGPAPRKDNALAAIDDSFKQWEWTPRDTGDRPNPQPNPIGEVPMVELPNRPLLADEPLSDVSGTIAMQDAINLLWSQLFTAADYAAFPQRVVMGQEPPKTPILDKQGQKIGEQPLDLDRFSVSRVAFFGNKDARIGEWQAANLKAYADIIEVGVGHIAAQTRTPQHYLIGRMANLSGDALIAAETGLVKRVGEKQLWFGGAIREVFRLVALAQNEPGKARAIAGGEVLWADPQSRNQAQLADALLKLKQIGFPFQYLALKYGLTPTEVAGLIRMREEEAAADPIAQVMNPRPGPAFDEDEHALADADDSLIDEADGGDV
ncbi:phage portal protein [Streptomyces cellulosae]